MPPKRLKTLWTDEVESTLISEIQRRPLVWDTTSHLYRRNDLKGPAFEEVASALKEVTHDETITGKMVSDPWKCIKSTFAENLRRRVRELKNNGSGSGADDVYKPKWNHFDKLFFFLRKTTGQAESTSNLTVPAIPEHQETSTELLPPDLYFDDTLNTYVELPRDILLSNEVSLTEENIFSLPQTPSVLSSSPVPSPSSSKDESSFQCPRSDSAPPRSFSASPRSVSAPPSNADKQGSMMYSKRGAKNAHLDEVVKVMNKIAEQPLPGPPQDSAEIFGALVAQRLREIQREKGSVERRQCEAQLITF